MHFCFIAGINVFIIFLWFSFAVGLIVLVLRIGMEFERFFFYTCSFFFLSLDCTDLIERNRLQYLSFLFEYLTLCYSNFCLGCRWWIVWKGLYLS